MRNVSKMAIVAACLALAACAGTPPPVIQVKTVEVDLPVATRCVDPAKVPAPVPGTVLSGDAVRDVAALARTDLALRSSVDQLMALIGPCTVNPGH